MSEHINNETWLSSGGHQWQWGPLAAVRKTLTSVGIIGGWSGVTAIGPRPGRIAGRQGGPAMLKATGADRAAADVALTAIIATIESAVAYGYEYAWEDDQGHSGAALVLVRFMPVGPRIYGRSGGSLYANQPYVLDVADNEGGLFA
jgi:hypothetical protein